MWSYELLNQCGKFKSHFRLSFMDGPFWLYVAKNKEMKLSVECVNDRKDEIVEFTFECDYVDFLTALHQAVRKLIKLIYDNKMHKGKTKSSYKQFVLIGNELKAAIDCLQ
jgi:hypothetical protein